jgi:hypothetical protein
MVPQKAHQAGNAIKASGFRLQKKIKAFDIGIEFGIASSAGKRLPRNDDAFVAYCQKINILKTF